MTLQYLHDLPRLEVPYIQLVVLTPADNIFTLRCNEACRYAVGSIAMSGIRLHTF